MLLKIRYDFGYGPLKNTRQVLGILFQISSKDIVALQKKQVNQDYTKDSLLSSIMTKECLAMNNATTKKNWDHLQDMDLLTVRQLK